MSTNVLPLTQVGNNTNSAISLTEIFDRVFSDVCNSLGFEVQKQKKRGSGNNRVYRNLNKNLNASKPSEHPPQVKWNCLKKNLNSSIPSEHPPVRGKDVKTLNKVGLYIRLQRQNLFMPFKRVPLCVFCTVSAFSLYGEYVVRSFMRI